MHLQSLSALSKAPGGAGSISKYIEALARATGVSGRLVYGFRTEFHFADVAAGSKPQPPQASNLQNFAQDNTSETK